MDPPAAPAPAIEPGPSYHDAAAQAPRLPDFYCLDCGRPQEPGRIALRCSGNCLPQDRYCIKCGQTTVEAPRVVCDLHGKKIFVPEQKAELRNQGLCNICIWNETEVKDSEDPNGARYSLCPACRARTKEYNKRAHARRKARLIL